MKKSFKRIVAVLLAVMMIVCSFPLTVLAADSDRTNVNLQFGDVSISSTAKTYTAGRGANAADFAKYTGLNSTKLDYSNNKITGYSTGNFFTVTVLVENISKISAAEVAIKYSDSISPAYVKNTNSGTAVALYSESGTALTDAQPLEAITSQSGNAIHNSTSTVGETSYIDADKKVMHAKFSVQTGADDVDVSSVSAGKYTYSNTAVLATFMFKIVSDGDITFSIDTDEDSYYLDTIANGGSTDEYKTYKPKAEGEKAELDFMGKNEYNGSTTTTYTITFNDEDGKVLQTNEYEEGTAVIAPALPAVSHDDEKHYTYSWDKEVSATATANATYTRVKTGTDHEWNQGEVTLEPTTTSTGIKTYTCTFDGCGATKTEVLPKKEEEHVHTWGEWKYNGDASFTSGTNYKDGTQTRTCTECGETETKDAPNTGLLYRRGNQLSLDSAILVKIMTTKSVVDYYDKVYMVAELNTSKGETRSVIEDYDLYYNNQYARFTFDEITPFYLNEEVNYTIYGVKDGVTYWGPTYSYAATSYVQSQFDTYSEAKYPNTYKNLRNLLADIIWYGYKSQVYTGYGITNGKKIPMTDYITAEQLAYRTSGDLDLQNVGSSTYETIDNPSCMTGFSARMGSSVDLMITLAKRTSAAPDLKTVTVQVQKEGQAIEYFSYENDPDMFKESGNYLVFYYNGVKGYEASTPVYIKLLDADGNVISNTRKCTIEGYCYTQINSSTASTSLKEVCDSIMRYAKSSAAYIANSKA